MWKPTQEHKFLAFLFQRPLMRVMNLHSICRPVAARQSGAAMSLPSSYVLLPPLPASARLPRVPWFRRQTHRHLTARLQVAPPPLPHAPAPPQLSRLPTYQLGVLSHHPTIPSRIQVSPPSAFLRKTLTSALPALSRETDPQSPFRKDNKTPQILVKRSTCTPSSSSHAVMKRAS